MITPTGNRFRWIGHEALFCFLLAARIKLRAEKVAVRRRKNPRKQAREAAGVSVSCAARAAGVCVSTFQRYESGAEVPYHRALPLSNLYKCPIEIFLRRLPF
jgi:hypothetical protein